MLKLNSVFRMGGHGDAVIDHPKGQKDTLAHQNIGFLCVGATLCYICFSSKGPMLFPTFKGSVSGEITRLKMWCKMAVYMLCIHIDEIVEIRIRKLENVTYFIC